MPTLAAFAFISWNGFPISFISFLLTSVRNAFSPWSLAISDIYVASTHPVTKILPNERLVFRVLRGLRILCTRLGPILPICFWYRGLNALSLMNCLTKTPSHEMVFKRDMIVFLSLSFFIAACAILRAAFFHRYVLSMKTSYCGSLSISCNHFSTGT